VDNLDRIRAAAIESAGDISGYPDFDYICKISGPLSDLQSALGEYSLDIDTDLGELTVRQLYQKYFDIAIAIGARDNPD
jgi:hypothetical protein